jgi:hypothetical protein
VIRNQHMDQYLYSFDTKQKFKANVERVTGVPSEFYWLWNVNCVHDLTFLLGRQYKTVGMKPGTRLHVR